MMFPNRATVLTFAHVVLRSPLTASFVFAGRASSAGAFPSDKGLRCGIAAALFLERLKELLPICEAMEVISLPALEICAIWSVRVISIFPFNSAFVSLLRVLRVVRVGEFHNQSSV
jgi:hypothetical protein